ncbi:GNAT family N-acetyltransferase [Veronia nyctiphanis]|uniref:GNAT family N-acetyltransferase n=1 Tax=Veronia nyctiphanis TaxID=1278244 RepID=A0A4Q0YP44_9GAMM|nr:GNAT family N-acetyltransferase [Veronia nyctiphanis]RXJ71714.1 GNAT family N-acetyltransferase [Veronia nyctiphanis]
MTIRLKPISKHNYEAICDLDASEAQQDFVAMNTWSIVESVFNDGYETRAIYFEHKPVGFFMWVKPSPDKTEIWRFMVDSKYQQQGTGTKALALALNEIRQNENLETIEISDVPKNPIAKDFYAKFGFEEIGIDEENEMVAKINVCQEA